MCGASNRACDRPFASLLRLCHSRYALVGRIGVSAEGAMPTYVILHP